ncbi:MAG TPA: methyltransferase domain-containing protein [Solirubrobacteraceae bacterium]
MTAEALAGTGAMQSQQEWDTRNRVLALSMSRLINRFAADGAVEGDRGIDVGCQKGALTDEMEAQTPFHWSGIDPTITEARSSPAGLELLPGTADQLPFEDASFRVALFANVYEHVLPERRHASLQEIRRVLAPGGFVVGQIPNPYFPIESHSRLPFMGWLPMRAQKAYWRLSPVPWEHDFFVVTMRQMRADAEQLGYRTTYVRNFNYPPEVIPAALRSAWRLLERPMRRMPWAWQFVFQRTD